MYKFLVYLTSCLFSILIKAAMSDSEDDDLLSFTPFSGTNKRRRTSSPSTNQDTSNNGEVIVISERNDMQAKKKLKTDVKPNALDDIEVEAKKKVSMSFVPSQITSPSMLYWQKVSKKKKKVNWFPCRECHRDEVIGLNLPQEWNEETKILVQYIEGTSFGNRALVNRKAVVGYDGNDVRIDLDPDPVDEVNPNEAEQKQKKDVVEVLPCWCPTRLEQMTLSNKKSKSKLYSDEASVRATELYMEEVLAKAFQRKEELEKERIATRKREAQDEAEWMQSNIEEGKEDGSDDKSPDSFSSAIISQSQEEVEYSSSDDSSNLLSQAKKKQLLRPGDIVQYYELNQKFGDADYLRTAEIEEIDCRKEMVLRLGGGVYLDRDQKINLEQRIYKGKLVNVETIYWTYVRNFKLRSAKSKKEGATGMKARAQQLKQLMDEKKKHIVESLKEKGMGQFAGFIK